MNLTLDPEQLEAWATDFGLRLLIAIAILIIGRWIAKSIEKVLETVLDKRKVDPTVTQFLGNLSYMLMMTLVVLAAVEKLGVKTTSFVAVIGAAGLAIGLALQGSLSNFASGVLLVMFRPFKVADFVEASGTMGVVEEIQVFATRMRTGDNKVITIPNSGIMNGPITNHTARDTRRAEFIFGIGYDDDLKKAKEILIEMFEGDERVLKDPELQVVVKELADSSVNLMVRAWVKTPDMWPLTFDMTEAVKLRFDQEGISIPYPQQDVHMHQIPPAS